jgi:hypothetical protein
MEKTTLYLPDDLRAAVRHTDDLLSDFGEP